MKVVPTQEDLATLEVDALVIGHAEGRELSGSASRVNQVTGGLLGRLLESRDITGKSGDVTTVLEPHGLRARALVVVGLGAADKMDSGVAFRAAGAAAKHLARRQRGDVAFYLGDHWRDAWHTHAVCGAIVGCHGQDLYRSERNLYPFSRLLWGHATDDALRRGRILGESVNLARRLVNQPPNILFPAAFAETAAQTCAASGIECEIWDEARLEQERCGSLLAVARGSSRPPRLVIMRYKGTTSEQPPLVLVGKGVTFDSGGLSIKPTDGMKTMKCDMSGAATVLGAMKAIADLKLPVHVIGLAGLVENLISGSSYKVGDVLTARSGKTIEVLNTDAEGRLVLADVLDVALEQQPGAIVDLATLTGACVVALGPYVAGLMSNHDTWSRRVADAASACGEAVWPLPMFAEFGEQIRSNVADIKNVGEGRYGGAITAAKFLEEFVGGRPWAHIDIAGPAFLDNPRPWIDGGGTGAFVRGLVELAQNWTGSVEP